MITIVQAKQEDIHNIDVIYAQKVDELANKGIVQWKKDSVSYATMSAFYHFSDFYFAYVDGVIAGAFVLVEKDAVYWKEDAAHTALYLHKIIVLDAFSKQGVSSAILDYFKQETKQRGYSYAKLDVRSHKNALRALYERNGFIKLDEIDLQMGYKTTRYYFAVEK